MEDMDAFLETHALRAIPAHLRDPQNVSSQRPPPTQAARVVFGLDTGILTVLLSLQYAVREAVTPPCGRALRRRLWSKSKPVLRYVQYGWREQIGAVDADAVVRALLDNYEPAPDPRWSIDSQRWGAAMNRDAFGDRSCTTPDRPNLNANLNAVQVCFWVLPGPAGLPRARRLAGIDSFSVF